MHLLGIPALGLGDPRYHSTKMFTDKRPDQAVTSDIPVPHVSMEDIVSTLVRSLDGLGNVLEEHHVIMRGNFLERTSGWQFREQDRY